MVWEVFISDTRSFVLEPLLTCVCSHPLLTLVACAQVRLPGGNLEVLFSDTVGFIQKLPTQLVAAFRATLEEIASASVVLHVLDVSADNAPAQCAAVLQVRPRAHVTHCLFGGYVRMSAGACETFSAGCCWSDVSMCGDIA
jgi:hypothetical protein